MTTPDESHAIIGIGEPNTMSADIRGDTTTNVVVGMEKDRGSTNTNPTTTHGHPPTFSVGGIYRRKHTLRAAFRSVGLVLLIGGYALYNHFGDSGGHSRGVIGGSGGEEGGMVFGMPRHNSNYNNLRRSGGSNIYDDGNDLNNDGGVVNLSRFLQGEEGEAAAAATADETPLNNEPAEAECPTLTTADPSWLAVFYAIGVLYMFLALAIVCDEFFVPALEEISSDHHLNLSMDVAGATLMAAGGSAPELFTSFVGTFQRSDIGIGTIVGSAVFNVLFVIGMCSLLSKEVLTLTWWPLFRDSAYYAVGLAVLSILAGVVTSGEVYWWESLILLLMYVGYVILMAYNRKLYKKLTGKELVLAGEEEEAEGEAEDDAENAENGAASDAAADATTNGDTDGDNKKNGENGGTHSGAASSDEFHSNNSAPVGTSMLAMPNPGSPRASKADFRWPGTFRAGVLKLLLHPESWEDKGGIGIVAKIQGDVDHVFKQIDINGDGSIDKEELGKLFEMLGHEISEDDLGQVFTSLDLDGNGTICEEEFAKWYCKSEERILSKVKPIFDAFDADKSGTIERDEVRKLLKTLDPNVLESDVDDAMNAMFKSGDTEKITYEEFADWYVHSIIYTKQQTMLEKKIEEEAQGVCEALSPPRGEGVCAWLKYLLVLPLVAALTLTIPDVRRPGYGKWCYLSFVLSICWIGIFSYFMVDWAEILGNTIGIPSVVMGYTILAAGTSVPDLLSSVIVARMGEGDMAVSSSIGSNIFDILVGLPLPWLVFSLYYQEQVIIQAKGIWQSIFILIGMLVAIIAIVHCQGWKMTRTLGGMMFILYFAFLVQAIVTEYYQNPCFGNSGTSG